VSVLATRPLAATISRRWRDPAAWVTTADVFVVLVAMALPWSTSLVSIFAAAFLVSMLPFLDVRDFLLSLRRPVCVLPMVLFALAVVGTLWSDAPWGARLYAIGPTVKLLLLPALFYHFERSSRGALVLIGFLVASGLLMVLSWVVLFAPQFKVTATASVGVPVKNYIDQSQEFVFCALALAYPVIDLLRANRIRRAVLLAAIALSFLLNMTFVIVSRTALVTMPVILVVFALLHLKWRSVVGIFCVALLFAGLAWISSPTIRRAATTVFTDYQSYQEQNAATSGGLRLEYWRKSLQFFAEAPILGHGTGSTRGLFERAAVGQTGASADVVGNPHNQTLYVAVQWGVVGVIALYAMWLMHLLLFRGAGLANWIGVLVVVQNIFTSLFNSHLFDFHEGWMYVLGVGVAGGMLLSTGARRAAVGPDRPSGHEKWYVRVG